ncbi:hypothetical protein KBA01_13580 [Kozakia baliensis]|nr:hypothetical protein KBA01_13580 [Kozakia baliensis]
MVDMAGVEGTVFAAIAGTASKAGALTILEAQTTMREMRCSIQTLLPKR